MRMECLSCVPACVSPPFLLAQVRYVFCDPIGKKHAKAVGTQQSIPHLEDTETQRDDTIASIEKQRRVSGMYGDGGQHLAPVSLDAFVEARSQPSTMASLADAAIADEVSNSDVESVQNITTGFTSLVPNSDDEGADGERTVENHALIPHLTTARRPVASETGRTELSLQYVDPWHVSFLPDASRVRTREDKIVYALTVLEGLLASSIRLCDSFFIWPARRTAKTEWQTHGMGIDAKGRTSDMHVDCVMQKCVANKRVCDFAKEMSEPSTMSALPPSDISDFDCVDFDNDGSDSLSTASDILSELATHCSDDQEWDSFETLLVLEGNEVIQERTLQMH